MSRYPFRYVLLVCCACILSAAEDNFILHRDEVFLYSVSIPSDWKKSRMDVENKHTIILSTGNNIDITVTALLVEGGERKKGKIRGEGDINGMWPLLLKIIETKELAVGNNTLCKILVYEYNQGGTRILKRSMFLKFSNYLLSIECRAPTRYFHRYTDVFNRVMASATFFGAAGAGENIKNKNEGEGGPVMKAQEAIKETRENKETKENKEIKETKDYIESELKTIEKLEQQRIIKRIE